LQADGASKNLAVEPMSLPQQHELTAFLLSTPLPLSTTACAGDMPQWQALARQQYTQWRTPFARAVAGGFCSGSIGIAFTSGYQAALQALAPTRVDYNAASFCVTESAGNKPSSIQTRLTASTAGHWILSGEKSFVSGADHARRLLVAATDGQDEQGRNRLVMVQVETDQPGVAIQVLPPLPFAPDALHGSVRFDQVAITPEQRLPGDGYAQYVKPFRTIEDIHVSAAILGYLVRIARQYGFPPSSLEQLLALIWLHQPLAGAAPAEPTTHLALAGARQLMESVLAALEACWAQVDPAVASAWQRDKALLQIAGKARTQRTLRAWETVTAP
jgi:hypothetical protein